MTDLTPKNHDFTAGTPSARDLYERYLREQDRKARGLPPEGPARYRLTDEQLERPDGLLDPNPEAAELLRHPERWPVQTDDGSSAIWIVRRWRGPRGHCDDCSVLWSDDPNLSRVIDAGWEAD